MKVLREQAAKKKRAQLAAGKKKGGVIYDDSDSDKENRPPPKKRLIIVDEQGQVLDKKGPAAGNQVHTSTVPESDDSDFEDSPLPTQNQSKKTVDNE